MTAVPVSTLSDIFFIFYFFSAKALFISSLITSCRRGFSASQSLAANTAQAHRRSFLALNQRLHHLGSSSFHLSQYSGDRFTQGKTVLDFHAHFGTSRPTYTERT
jgi:hypothetical protein